jgi:hypothetical protein
MAQLVGTTPTPTPTPSPAEYTDRVVMRFRLPYTTSNQFGYYTLMNASPVMARWAFSRWRDQINLGERISLWHTDPDTGSEELDSFERIR